MSLPDVLLIGDLRDFRDPGVPVTVARTSADGLAALEGALAAGHRWEQVWLDHDLGGADTIAPVVDWLCSHAARGEPPVTVQVLVHTSNIVGGDTMVRALKGAGYRTMRVSAPHYLHVPTPDPSLSDPTATVGP
jgi:hypothetical protein